ncbi:hypothetical protein JMUB590_2113 [Staphylococcus caprae]|uniref:Uncharacterized protein n=1 Tax=Staphylococcus caprae TaxID=29380 RepID=A0ABM7FR35_9STAP|nr:hypothetical protein JMUB590_2113 [Staphylococcus caprae]BBD95670.1 hypothetical protein JMUB898_2105 [Staphylococcus caprae]
MSVFFIGLSKPCSPAITSKLSVLTNLSVVNMGSPQFSISLHFYSLFYYHIKNKLTIYIKMML